MRGPFVSRNRNILEETLGRRYHPTAGDGQSGDGSTYRVTDGHVHEGIIPARYHEHKHEVSMDLGYGGSITITEGADYVYTSDKPAGARGQRYKVHRFILDVPSYQRKVLVEALTGPDKGMWFTCSLSNFSFKYKRAAEPEVAAHI